MFIFSDSIKKNSTIRTDICLVGSGAAGIAFVQKFLDSKARICVLESGNFEKAKRPDPLYDFEAMLLPVSLKSRARAFGGTTTAWGGCWKYCDAIDFKRRDWVPHSGWPISREDIAPYYREASQSLHAPDPTVDGKSGSLQSTIMEPTAFPYQRKDRRHWGETFRNVLEESQTISICLNAHVVRIEKTAAGVTAIHARTLAGNAFEVKPQALVLAAGGIENARILLISDIGNEHDQVGRYYMDHPKGKAGAIEAYRPVDLSNYWIAETKTGQVRIGFRLSDEIQERHRILNSHIFLEPIADRSLASIIATKFFHTKKSPVVAVHNRMEQAPVASNRVYLGDKRDAFGCPKAKIDWSISELDKRTMVVFHELLQKELQRLGIGELDSSLLDKNTPDFLIMRDAFHHMGTTRMGSDPKTSVVDRNCKVHSMANLFIAGSSVFSTSGYANPVATIAALAIRLADHLKERI